jgi:hypothetical protein
MTVVTERPTGPPPTDPIAILGTDLFRRLATRIATDHPDIARPLAERIVTQMVAYLQLCAANTGPALVPSKMVDIGWHAFILHTMDYAEFCQRIAGRFLHHVPEEEPNHTRTAAKAAAAVGATVAALGKAGLPVDPELWFHQTQCSQCYQGCHDDPKAR